MSNTALLGAYGDLANSGLMFRNRIINGNFDVWQRGTSASPPNVATGAYVSADRWKCVFHKGTVGWTNGTLTQTTDVPNSSSKYAIKLVSTDAGLDDAAMVQFIESANCYDLVGKQITLSFWVKKGALALTNHTFIADISSLNVADTRPDYIHDQPMSGTTAIQTLSFAASSLPNSWTKYTVTTNALPASAANGLAIRFCLRGGDTGLGDLFFISQVQLEVGSVATPLEQRPIGLEEYLCMRYFEKFDVVGQYIEGQNSAYQICSYTMQVRKRISTGLSVTAVNMGYYSGGSGGIGFTPNILGANTTMVQVGVSGVVNCNGFSNGTLLISAEI